MGGKATQPSISTGTMPAKRERSSETGWAKRERLATQRTVSVESESESGGGRSLGEGGRVGVVMAEVRENFLLDSPPGRGNSCVPR